MTVPLPSRGQKDWDIVLNQAIRTIELRANVGPVFTYQGSLVPYASPSRYYFEVPNTLAIVRASVGTPSTGANIVVDVLLNGVSIGHVTIPAGQNTATLTPATPVKSGDYATISILQVGSTVAGSDLTVALTIKE